jgi:hypothetical protein
MRIRQRQTVIRFTPSRPASTRHELGARLSMSSSTCWNFSGRRTRASAVPVAEENVRRHALHRHRRIPVPVAPPALQPRRPAVQAAVDRFAAGIDPRPHLDASIDPAQPRAQLPNLHYR